MKKRFIIFVLLNSIMLIISILDNTWRSFFLEIVVCLIMSQMINATRKDILKITFIGIAIFIQIRMIIGVVGYLYKHDFSFPLFITILLVTYTMLSIISIGSCILGAIILLLRKPIIESQ